VGNVRPSRMIFGDGAAAFVVGPAPAGEAPDIEYLQTYASGPASQVNSIIWPDPDGAKASLLESVDLVVPHQANKTMVIDLAKQAGLSEDSLYFNVETVGNASSASIPLAIHDAVRDGVIKEPTRIFAPGFGAGAVAGYAVMRIDPAVVAISTDL